MRAIATISQSALLHNLSVVKKYAPQAKVVAMVKANNLQPNV
jgi:alanine racemase